MSSARLAGASCLVLAGLAGCGDGGKTAGPADPDLRVVGTVQAAGIMNVRTEGVSLSQDRYDAILGGAELIFARLDDSTLVAVVPDMPAGSYDLSASIAGQNWSETVNVVAALAVADPVAQIEQELDGVLAVWPEAAPDGVAQTSWDAQRDSVIQAVADAQSAIDGMSAEEQLATARFMAALEQTMAPLFAESGPLLMAAGSVTAECEAKARRAHIYTAAYVAGIVGVVGGVLIPGYFPIAIAGGIVIWKARQKQEKAILEMAAVCNKQEDVLLDFFEDGPAGTGFQLASGGTLQPDGGQGLGGLVTGAALALPNVQSSARVPFVRERPVSATPRQDIQPFSASHIEENAIFARISSLLDDAYNAIQDLPELARRAFPKIIRISTIGEKPIERTSLGPDSVRIANVTGGVSLSSGASGETLVLTADAPGEDEREFSFDVVSMIDPDVSSTIDAILVKGGVTLIPRAESWSATVTTNEAAGTWRMTCRMEWTVAISGVDPVHLSSMTWNNQTYSEAFPDAPGSEQYPPNSYEPGTVVLWGEWWREYGLGHDSSDFFVTLGMGYRNTVTSETGTSNEIRMDCKLPQ